MSPRVRLTEVAKLRNRLEAYTRSSNTRFTEFEALFRDVTTANLLTWLRTNPDGVDAIKAVVKKLPELEKLVYGDNSKPESGGLRELILAAIERADKTEAQRKKDRLAEEEAAKNMLANVEKLLQDRERRRGRKDLVRDAGTLILVVAAAVEIITAFFERHPHLFGN